jgi:ectoine hydroxylase-related dioxygenase (phytanoyl-CoA dioxygenase family)
MISSAQQRHYWRDGILFPIRVLSDEEVSVYRCAFEDLESRAGGKLEYAGNTHLFFRWAYELAVNPAVLSAVGALLGPRLLVRGSLILCKHGGDPAYVSWHQDGAYDDVEWTATTSAWIALSDSTRENGCMKIIDRSHELGRLRHTEKRDRHNLLSNGQRVAADESRSIDVVLRAGEMSLHHAGIIHGSDPNRSTAKRIGFIARYATPLLRGHSAPVQWAQGEGELPDLEVWQPPVVEQPGSAFSRWAASPYRRRAAKQVRVEAEA